MLLKSEVERFKYLSNLAAKEVGLQRILSLSELRWLIKLIDFYLQRAREEKDFLIVNGVVKRYLKNIQETKTENKIKSNYLFFVFQYLTTLPKGSATNCYGGQRRKIKLSFTECSLVAREAYKDVTPEEIEKFLNNFTKWVCQ